MQAYLCATTRQQQQLPQTLCVAAGEKACAPASLPAPAGISVDSGSNISKDAADVLLLEKSLTACATRPCLHPCSGISVDSGSDISKDAADVILLEKSLTVLTHGVTRGRLTHGNTIKVRQEGVVSWWNGSELDVTLSAPTRQHSRGKQVGQCVRAAAAAQLPRRSWSAAGRAPMLCLVSPSSWIHLRCSCPQYSA